MKIAFERVYHTANKQEWGEGPWQDEPDKAQWTDEATGLPCLAVRNHSGAWCGYVGVDENHPLFERDYDEAPVEVHGGLTYADHCMEGAEETAICHVPKPGEPDHVWWFGFDCAHAFDRMPEMEARLREVKGMSLEYWERGTYKTFEYVQKEIADLAMQLKEAGRGKTH